MNKKLVITFGLVVLAVGMLSITETAWAQQATPIYNNTTPDVDNESWMAGNENVTINSFGTMLTRIGTFVIGGTESGAGPFFTGLLVAGLLVGLVGPSRVGLVAGGMLGVVTAAALTGPIAIGPTWVYGVVVMLVGFVTAIVYLRMMR